MLKVSLALFSILWMGSVGATKPPNIVTIYGLENEAKLHSGKQNTNIYRLQIGAFKSERNARNCIEGYRLKTSFKLQMIPPTGTFNKYLVVLGPVPNALALKAVSQDLLSNKSQRLPKKEIAEKTLITKGRLAVKQSMKPIVKNTELTNKRELPQQKKSSPPISIAMNKSSQENLPNLLDENAIQANDISKVMRTTKKMTIENKMDRKSIENKTWTLKSEATTIDKKLETETSSNEILALQKRKSEVTQELNKIMTDVIRRISLK